MALAVRRVGGTAYGQQTYTLGANESMRVDSVTFSIEWANDGVYAIPALTATSSGGALIAELAAPALLLSTPPLSPFAYSGPAVMADAFSVYPPGGYNGYLLHDFGAAPITTQITSAYDQPPGLQAWADVLFLRSAGAVSMTSDIGNGLALNTPTVTMTMTSPVAAGNYLLLHLTFVCATDYSNIGALPPPTVTDSVGGNFLDLSGNPVTGYAENALVRADGLFQCSLVEFYRIFNPLAVGDTVTLTLNTGPASWLEMQGHELSGVTLGHPTGPNAGGNYVEFGRISSVSPMTSIVAPVPKFVGAAIINSSYVIGGGGTLNVSLARGGVEIEPVGGSAPNSTAVYVQAPLPELHLGPLDQLTISSQDTLNARTGDRLLNFNVYGVDE